MRMTKLLVWSIAACCAFTGFSRPTWGHGYAGDRFFPPTISTDDPFAVDELALPTISYAKSGSPGGYEVDSSFEFDKEILPGFALGISDTYLYQKENGSKAAQGLDNLTLTAKYQLLVDARHEAILSLGVEAEIGGTGYKSIGRESSTTFTPTVYFGKGFGDLPDSLGSLRPFAVTGTIGQGIPTSSEGDRVLEWGFAVEYSLPYLMQNVKDIGLPRPFRDMIPIVEFSFETGENHEERGITTGTINPGVLWETPYYQVGVEANIPVNSRSGTHVGVTFQVWIFIDDIFPKTFGHPLFGGE